VNAVDRAETMGNAVRRPATVLTDTHTAGIFIRVGRYGHPPGVEARDVGAASSAR
jgi:hypothetical protein